MSSDLAVILTTIDTQENAQKLATELLDHKLAACVSIQAPVTSYYEWEGQRCCESEIPILIKSLATKTAQIRACFDTHHPYDCPEYIVLEGQGSAAYAGWVTGQLSSR